MTTLPLKPSHKSKVNVKVLFDFELQSDELKYLI